MADMFQTLAQAHLQAWSTLASSAIEVAALPVRTVQALVTGEPPVEQPDPAEQLAGERARFQAREADWRERLEAAAAEVGSLRRDFARLEAETKEAVARAIDDEKLAVYRTLEPLLTQLPVVRHAVAQGREVEAPDVLALLGPLDTALAAWGLEAIGAVGATVAFDPRLHQLARGPAPEPGAAVVVKHVGYRLGDRVLRRARVSPQRP